MRKPCRSTSSPSPDGAGKDEPNTELQLEIIALDDDGAGFGTMDGGLELHVPGTLPGELVTATVAHRSPHRAVGWGQLVEVERKSPSRQAPTCPAFGACGGCALGHFEAHAQASYKGHAFAQAAAGAQLTVEPLVESPRALGYRNRSKLMIARAGEHVLLGGYRPRTHDVIDLGGCRLVAPELDALVASLRAAIVASGIAIYDETRRDGELRYVFLRSNHAQHILITLVTTSETVNQLDDLVRALSSLPSVVGIVQNVNATHGNVLFGEHGIVRHGVDFLDEELAGVALHVSWRSFFQVNRDVAAAIWSRVRTAIARVAPRHVVDVYCGTGGVGFAAAGDARLTGIEVVPAAIADAERSIAKNRVRDARFLAGDAATLIGGIDDADAIIVNPPRRGCDRVVLDAAAQKARTMIVYVSCNPQTLLRDLALLAARGWQTQSLTAFDMMPHTPHLEAVAILRRANAHEDRS